MTTSKNLYLTTVDREFHPDHADVIGPWCFQGAENIYPAWDEIDFVEPFSDPTVVCREAKNAENYTRFFIGELVPMLNSRHGVDYDYNFWHGILVGWVGIICLFVTARYWHIKAFLNERGALHYKADLVNFETPFLFPVSKSVSDALNNHDFDWWITSEIIRALKPININLETLSKNHFECAEYNDPEEKRNFPRISSLHQMPVWWTFFFNIFLGVVRRKGGADIQCEQGGFPPDDRDLHRIIEKIIMACLPESLGKNFNSFNGRALGYKFCAGKMRISSSDIHDEPLAFLNAHAQRLGEIVGYSQHGAFYGNVTPYNQGIASEYAKSFFLTWGWHKHDGHKGKFIPLPLCPSRVSVKKKGKNILFLGNINNTLKHTLSGQAPPGVVVKERHDKVEFFSLLRDDIREAADYRPHIFHAGIDDAGYLLQQNLIKNVLMERNISGHINNAKLIVSNCYGTSMHRTLEQNIPTICFFKDFPPLTQSAQVDFDALRRVGVVHDTADSAAMFINKIWDDVDAWWTAPETQHAVLAWRYKNMRVSRFWFLHWIKFILFYKFS